jgi:hypothetical protein
MISAHIGQRESADGWLETHSARTSTSTMGKAVVKCNPAGDDKAVTKASPTGHDTPQGRGLCCCCW